VLAASAASRASYGKHLVLATALTGILGLALKKGIETFVLGGPKAEIEHLWRNLPLMAVALMAAGVLILATGLRDTAKNAAPLTAGRATAIGLVQGLCLPFRGFSRSGATVSAGLFAGLPRSVSEEFSFALAVLLTPPVIALELHRLVKAGGRLDASLVAPGVAGMALSFVSGTLALRVLSRALEKGRFWIFGFYCLAFGTVVLVAHIVLEV
jgi:undecaprenyl-diphosphatase